MKYNITININDSLYYSKKNVTKKSFFVSFKYNELLVATIKSLPERRWIADRRVWEIPYSEENERLLKYLLKDFSEDEGGMNRYELSNKKVDYSELSKIQISKEDIRVKAKLFNHQIDVIKYGILKNSFLLGDEMGLGKTLSLINYGLYKKYNDNYKHCLVVTGINGLKYNWYYEIKKYIVDEIHTCKNEIHTCNSGMILGSSVNKSGNLITNGTKGILKDLDNIDNIKEYFLITNIHSIRNKKILDKLMDLIYSDKINMVVLDEAQVIKSNNSLQTKNFLKLNPRTKILATGTPIMNNPIELWPALYWLNVDLHNFYQFKNYYCVMGGYKNYQIVNYKHLDELQNNLNKIMLRRLRKDTIDLPDKIYKTEFLEMEKEQSKIYLQVKNQIITELKEDKSLNLNQTLVKLIRLRQTTADASIVSDCNEAVKMDRLKELAEELYKNNKKFIVFSNWETVIKKAYNILKPYNPSVITGSVKEDEREMEIAMFRDNDNFCILGTVGALGTGYTLVEADTVIFLDSPWNSATKEQAIDRAYRIGQKNNITVITLVCKNTIDEKIEELIYSKKLLSDSIVDAKIDLKNKEEVANYLLS